MTFPPKNVNKDIEATVYCRMLRQRIRRRTYTAVMLFAEQQLLLLCQGVSGCGVRAGEVRSWCEWLLWKRLHSHFRMTGAAFNHSLSFCLWLPFAHNNDECRCRVTELWCGSHTCSDLGCISKTKKKKKIIYIWFRTGWKWPKPDLNLIWSSDGCDLFTLALNNQTWVWLIINK